MDTTHTIHNNNKKPQKDEDGDNKYSWAEYRKTLNRMENLGEGTYQTCCKVLVLNTTPTKLVTCQHLSIVNTYREEILNKHSYYLSYCNDNPYLISIYKVFFEKKKNDTRIYIIREYVKDTIERLDIGHLTLYQIKKMMYQLLIGVNCLHRNGIVHGSILSHRILIQRERHQVERKREDKEEDREDGEEIRLDKVEEEYTLKLIYSPFYSSYSVKLAPEQIVEFINNEDDNGGENSLKNEGEEHYTKSFDIWCIGIIFFKLLKRYPLGKIRCRLQDDGFERSDVGYLYSLFRIMGTPNLETWPSINSSYFPQFPGVPLNTLLPPDTDPLAINLLSNMLVLNPDKRIDTFTSLKHPYFEDFT